MATTYMAKGDSNGNPIKIYSTDEILTGGVWIDGSPIYRKVIPFTIIGDSLTIDITSLNRVMFLNKVVNILSPYGKYVSNLSTSGGGLDEIIVVDCIETTDVDEIYIDSYTLIVSTGVRTAYTPNSNGYVILEYTKNI